MRYRIGRPVRRWAATTLALASAALVAAAPPPAEAQVSLLVLYSFTGAADGATPEGALFADTFGGEFGARGLYVTTSQAGIANATCPTGCGTAFKLAAPKRHQTAWTGTPLWDFSGGADGNVPLGGVSSPPRPHVTSQTPLFGTTSGFDGGNGTVFSLAGTTLTTLYAFTGGTDGAAPVANVVTDAKGALYTTTIGFTEFGTGTAIKLTPPPRGQTAWTETTLWVFSGGNDGGGPYGLAVGPDGGVYGTTAFGGIFGGGTVFKLIPPSYGQTAWGLQTIWNFGNTGDGFGPFTAPTIGPDGTIYGTTSQGGGGGYGIVFALTPAKTGRAAWTEKVLYSFTGGSDGATPLAPLLLDHGGAIFGSASAGGSVIQAGTIFRLSPPARGQSAWAETTLWQFSGGDGFQPTSTLAADGFGTLYGTTAFGGAGGPHCTVTGPYAGCGVVFSLTGTGVVP
jgi:hypothetical protein